MPIEIPEDSLSWFTLKHFEIHVDVLQLQPFNSYAYLCWIVPFTPISILTTDVQFYKNHGT